MTVGFEAIGGMDGLKRKLEASILAGLKHAEVFAPPWPQSAARVCCYSLVGRRTVSTGGGGGGGQVQLRILSTLLTEMDGIVGGTNEKHILVVAATNRPEMIDDALMRPGRFDKLIHVPAPDLRSRMALMELHGKRMPFDENLDLETIVRHTEGYSGADICNLCNEAAIQTFQRDPEATKIEMQDFEKVLYKLKSSLTQSQISAYYKFAQRSQ
ncbi:GL13247 [Drosophila persimilis]|uniref:GL13247 n=1 Tax=Drosophila persimilis TaxID=7234 RepID=B4H783_DROPE|nr:GL13247 [Drosophila persimilis]